MSRRAAPFLLGVLLAMTSAGSTSAQAPDRAVVDRITVRFYAPETGGSARPRFITERVLGFEARLEAMFEKSGQIDSYEERHVRAAMEHHIAQEMLARLPLDRPPSAQDLAQVFDEVGQALIARVGGREALLAAARTEGIDPVEVNALLQREALAAMYIDRAISPILRPTDEQLREVYRTAPHPYRGVRFEQARAPLSHWFVAERLRAAQSAFLQSARARVKIVLVPK